MNHLDLIEKKMHNRQVEFEYEGEVLVGVLMDIIPYNKKKVDTEYVFVPNVNLLTWKAANESNDTSRMSELSCVVDIKKINNGRALIL